jgi:hypothetical protein
MPAVSVWRSNLRHRSGVETYIHCKGIEHANSTGPAGLLWQHIEHCDVEGSVATRSAL